MTVVDAHPAHEERKGMGINIGISIMEAPSAPCRELRSKVLKVRIDDPEGFEAGAIYDELVDYDTAKRMFPDWEAFVKRNRLNEEADAVYLGMIKKADDLEKLRPVAERRYTGWVDVQLLPEGLREEASSASEETITGWDYLSFDEMNAMCSSCPLSWDKGRGCIGAFGPDNSLLPGIAEKHGCRIVASVPQSVKDGRTFGPSDAEELLKEVEILKDALPKEGKMMVRRYSGPVERMEAVARISKAEGCGFNFF